MFEIFVLSFVFHHSFTFDVFTGLCFVIQLVLSLVSKLTHLSHMDSLGLPPVWERAADSACHLQFCCLLRCVGHLFPLMFRTSFEF